MKKHYNAHTALLLLIFCVIALYGILTTPHPLEDELVGSLALSWLSLGGCALCALLLFFRSHKAQNTRKHFQKYRPIFITLLYYIFFALYIGGMIFLSEYLLSHNLWPLSYGAGFSIASVLFLSFSFFFLGRKNFTEISFTTFGTVSALLLIFGHFFNIMLP